MFTAIAKKSVGHLGMCAFVSSFPRVHLESIRVPGLQKHVRVVPFETLMNMCLQHVHEALFLHGFLRYPTTASAENNSTILSPTAPLCFSLPVVCLICNVFFIGRLFLFL